MSELNSEDLTSAGDRLDRIVRSSRDDASSSPPRIGRYPIVAELGQGGQARTFRAVHPGFQATVVLKLAHRPADPEVLDRITSEGRLLANLPPHPNLLKIHDVDLHEGRVFLVLEDVPGLTLEESVKDRPLDVQGAARAVAATARAVHFAHEQGITHLDLNPRNVLIDREGQPRVIDFGMAWSRPWWIEGDGPRFIGGTPRYLSPEQACGQSDRIGRATDVFGLGGILYFLLTNTPLYSGEDRLAVLQRAREARFDRQSLERPGIPPRLREICLKALAEDPSDRYRTAAELAEALERFDAPRHVRYRSMLAAVFMVAFGLAWVIGSRQAGETPLPEGARQTALEIRIWRPETGFQPLPKALPLRSGDEIQVRCRVPKGQAVSMYFINTLGRVRLLKHHPAAAADREITYPEVGQTRVLEGQPGTEMILAWGGSEPDDVQRSWDDLAGGDPWPRLPPTTVVRLTADRVDIGGGRDRDLGETRDRADPEERIRNRLDDLRKRLTLTRRSAFFEGLAFAHE